MNRLRRLSWSIALAGMFAGGSIAPAQEPGPAPTPVPAPATTSGMPDIESLREVGSTSKLIPAAPTPDPLSTPQSPDGTPNGRHRNGGGGGLLGGGHRRSARANDLTAGQADSDPLAIRVAYRRAKTEAGLRDPGLADLWEKAQASTTQADKRVWLKEYYTRLFAEVRKIDPSPAMKAHVDLLELVAAQHYNPQRRTVGGEEDLVRGEGNNRRGRAR